MKVLPLRRAWVAAALGSLIALNVQAGAESGVYRFDVAAPLASAIEFPPWAELMARQGSDDAVRRACLDNRTACPFHLRGYRTIVKRAADTNTIGKLQLVNRFVNQRRWVHDRHRTGKPDDDVWLPLGVFLREGGDCEDFAIAKYFMLRDLGFRAEDLRIVIGYDNTLERSHAVVAVQFDGQVVLMETDDSIKRPRQHHDYDFLYAINERWLWDHTTEPVVVDF